MITEPTSPPSGLASPSCYASSCGRVTLYHGRWQDLLPLPVDAIITDQPYGTGWIRGGGKKEGEFKRRKETSEWDVFDVSWLQRAPEVVAAFCPIQGVWEMCLHMDTPHVLKYRKTNPAPFGADREPIVSSRPLNGSWEKEAYNGDNPLHPCQKPLPLMGWLVHELTMEGQTVCDPFMGSGSTGIACIRANRRFVGIEQDPTHYATALERITNELRQGDLCLGHNVERWHPLQGAPRRNGVKVWSQERHFDSERVAGCPAAPGSPWIVVSVAADRMTE